MAGLHRKWSGGISWTLPPAPTSQAQAAEILDRLRSGESWSGEFWMKRRDGTTFPALVTDSPVYNATGQVIAIVGVSLDITERKRAEEASRFLAEASVVPASSPDDTAILQRLAQLAVPRLADWCAVEMVADDGAFQRLVVAHIDPTKVELAWELERRYGFDPTYRREPPEYCEPAARRSTLRFRTDCSGTWRGMPSTWLCCAALACGPASSCRQWAASER